jgi:hypothetical protein
MLPDGSLLFAGQAYHTGGSAGDMAIGKLDSLGQLDTSFGPNHDGWAYAAFDQGGPLVDYANAVTLDNSGRIVIGGLITTSGSASAAGVARCSGSGIPDTGFGFQGLASVSIGDYAAVNSIFAYAGNQILLGLTIHATNPTGLASLLEILAEDGSALSQGGNTAKIVLPVPADFSAIDAAILRVEDKLYFPGAAFSNGGERSFAIARAVLPIFNDGFETLP